MAGKLDLLDSGTRRLIAWGASSPLRAALVAALVALTVILPGLAAMPVTDRDEARFAQATRQMMESGHYVDIRFQDEPRWKKPIGIYWLQAAAAETVGEGAKSGIWAYRVPSALGLLLAAMLLGWAARPVVGGRGAVLAGAMLAATPVAAAEAHIAKTDAALLACAVAAFGAFTRLCLAGDSRRVALVFWLAIAAAILIKGPVVPVIVLFTGLWMWLVGRQPPPLGRFRFLPGLALTALIVAPWLVAIWIVSQGAFFTEAVGHDFLGKLTEGQEKHWGPPGLYALLFWLTFWPWAAMLPPALPWLWARRRKAWLVLIAGWVIPFWLVLEAVPTKLPHYVLPLYPAMVLAILAWALDEGRPTPGKWLNRVNAVLAGLPPVLLAAAAVAIPLVLEHRVLWPALLLGLVAAAAAVLAARAALAARPLAQIGAGLIGAMALYPAVMGVALPALTTAFPSPRMAALAAEWRPCASGPLISAGFQEPSLVFLTETGTVFASDADAAARLAADPGAMVLVEGRHRAAFDAALGGIPVVERGSLAYYNYNRGKRETAALVTRDDPRWGACPQ